MPRLLDRKPARIKTQDSPFSFVTRGGEHWEIWDRYIAFNGQKIYHIGNVCDTCAFFFEKLGDAQSLLNPAAGIEILNSGMRSVKSGISDVLMQIMPAGAYEVVLLSIEPEFVVQGEARDYFVKEQPELWGFDGPCAPGTNYYRGSSGDIGDNKKLFEFFVPLNASGPLDERRIDFYKEQILKGHQPTALALSVLDVKEPACLPGDGLATDLSAHWCLAHYMIDGHHKIKAASDLKAEITLLSFIARDQGVSSAADIAELLKHIG